MPGCEGAGGAERSYLTQEARGGGWEEQPQVQGAVAAREQEGLEELVHIKVRRGGGEEIPLVQGKEQRLRFAGAALKRFLSQGVAKWGMRVNAGPRSELDGQAKGMF